MGPARFPALEGIETHQLRELEEIRDASRFLQRLVDLGIAARNVDISPELRAQLRYFLQREAQPLLVARHPAVLPHDLAELAVKRADGAGTLDREELLRPLRHLLLGRLERRVPDVDLRRPL